MKISKKKLIIRVLFSALIILVTGGIVGYKMYTKPHRNVETVKSITVAAAQLATDFENDETRSNSLYLDKVLEVSGEVNEITKNQKGETLIVLKGTGMSTVRCTLEEDAPPEIKSGSIASFKGICTGYLTDVVMVRCRIQNK
jgi:tRNA_anti-like